MRFIILSLILMTAAYAQERDIPERVSSSVQVALNEVLANALPAAPSCNAVPPLACGGRAQIENYNPAQYMNRHGQIFFGSGPFYISHLPLMFRPHNFQAIYEVDFPDTPEGRAMKARYLARPDQGFASFAPGENWSYPDFDCSLDQAPRTLAVGGLHQAQYEEGGSLIGRTGLIVKRRIFFRYWDVDSFPEGQGSANANGEYIVFGEGEQFFTARVVASNPDADHIQPVPAAMFRNQVGGANHACYDVAQQNGNMGFAQKRCADSSAPAPTPTENPQTVRFNPFYVETEDISL